MIRYRTILLPALCLALLGTALYPVHAQGLRSRLRGILNRQERVREQIRDLKQTQRSASSRLAVAQRALAGVQDRLSTARAQLTTTRRELAATRAEIARLEKVMTQHQEAVSLHLQALYRSEQTGYLSVIMQAESFEDFANRGHYVRSIVNQDQYLLNRLNVLQAQAERQRELLEEKERRRARLVSQIAADEAEARRRKAEVRQILSDANSKRSAAEQMLAEMEEEENDIARQIRASSSGAAPSYSGSWSGSFLKPVPGRITSSFGMRVHPITGRYKLHTAVDIGAGYGTPIRSADKGMVISAGWKSAYGNTVVLSHGSGMYTWYAHCSSLAVGSGAMVTRGQVIAYVGSTGYSTGPHLHFGASRNGDWINPLNY